MEPLFKRMGYESPIPIRGFLLSPSPRMEWLVQSFFPPLRFRRVDRLAIDQRF